MTILLRLRSIKSALFDTSQKQPLELCMPLETPVRGREKDRGRFGVHAIKPHPLEFRYAAVVKNIHYVLPTKYVSISYIIKRTTSL